MMGASPKWEMGMAAVRTPDQLGPCPVECFPWFVTRRAPETFSACWMFRLFGGRRHGRFGQPPDSFPCG